MEQKVLLVDLERTKETGVIHYWKSGGRGYTREIENAGLYLLENALGISENDYNKNTAIIPYKKL